MERGGSSHERRGVAGRRTCAHAPWSRPTASAPGCSWPPAAVAAVSPESAPTSRARRVATRARRGARAAASGRVPARVAGLVARLPGGAAGTPDGYAGSLGQGGYGGGSIGGGGGGGLFGVGGGALPVGNRTTAAGGGGGGSSLVRRRDDQPERRATRGDACLRPSRIAHAHRNAPVSDSDGHLDAAADRYGKADRVRDVAADRDANATPTTPSR